MDENLTGQEYLRFIRQVIKSLGTDAPEDDIYSQFQKLAKGRNYTRTTFRAKLAIVRAE